MSENENDNDTMRVWVRVRADVALRLLDQQHWEDLHTDLGRDGLWCDDRPRGCGLRDAPGRGVIMGGGTEGATLLCTDIPEDVYREREIVEGTRPLTAEEAKQMTEGGPEPENMEYQNMGYAIIPAEVLNQFGPPRLWGHEHTGSSRKELLDAIALWEKRGDTPEMVKELQDAVAFHDQVGWTTPLCLREQPPAGYMRHSSLFDAGEAEEIDPE
jgi:hypothetical protein